MGFKRYLSKLSNNDVEALLREARSSDDYDMAVGGLGNIINVRELVALLAWITNIYASGGYEVEGFVLLGDVECEEPETVAVHIKGCGLEERGAIARSVKQQLREEGFVDLAGRVTIVCVVHSRLSAGASFVKVRELIEVELAKRGVSGYKLEWYRDPDWGYVYIVEVGLNTKRALE